MIVWTSDRELTLCQADFWDPARMVSSASVTSCEPSDWNMLRAYRLRASVLSRAGKQWATMSKVSRWFT